MQILRLICAPCNSFARQRGVHFAVQFAIFPAHFVCIVRHTQTDMRTHTRTHRLVKRQAEFLQPGVSTWEAENTHTCTHTCRHTHTYTHTHTCTHTHTHAHMHTRARTHTHTHCMHFTSAHPRNPTRQTSRRMVSRRGGGGGVVSAVGVELEVLQHLKRH